MIEWFVEIGMYLIGLAVIFVGSCAMVLWGLFGDRSKGRSRCPRCWYDMRGRRERAEGLVCPECGHNARQERRLYKNHRRWRAIVLGALLAVPSGYPLWVYCGWYREQPAIKAFEEEADPDGASSMSMWPIVEVESIGPPWLVKRLPKSLAGYLDRVVTLNICRRTFRVVYDPDGSPKFDFGYGPESEWCALISRLERLPHLRKVCVYGSIPESAMVHFKGLRRLRELDLRTTEITGRSLSHLASLPELEHLHLRHCKKLTDDAFANIRELRGLQKLNLNDTSVTDANLVHLADLVDLRELDLRSTTITDGGLRYIKGLTRLESLDLTDTSITDSGLASLEELANVKALYLSGTLITDAGLVHLEKLTNLKRLNVRATRITEAGLIHLEGLTGLEYLNLGERAGTSQGIARLQRVLPNCQIIGQ